MNFDYYRVKPLIVIVLSLGAIIDNLLVQLTSIIQGLSFEDYRLPSTLTILMLLLWIYDRFLWQIPVLGLLIKVPNMKGRYKGKIEYKFEGKEQSKECRIEVFQTASKINVKTYFNNESGELTDSKSIIERIRKDDDGTYEIFLFYTNHGTKKDGKLAQHEGANVLKYFPKKEKKKPRLEGYYFTNREPQTRGVISTEYKSKKRKGKF